MSCQKAKRKSTHEEMLKEMEVLRKEITFREYLGFEMCYNIFKKKYPKITEKQ